MKRIVLFAALTLGAATASATPPAASLEDLFWDFVADDNPAFATDTGLHTHDDRLQDWSAPAVAQRIARYQQFLKDFDHPTAKEILPPQDDVELMRHYARAELFRLQEWPLWQVAPRLYTGAAVDGAYQIVKRDFAPPVKRLALVIAREKAIPALLAQAKANLKDVPRISVELTLEELPGGIDFLQHDVVAAFKGVKDAALQAELVRTTATATKALGEFGEWLKASVLPRAKPQFAIGEQRFVHKLAVDEGIDEPLDKILARGEAELARLQAEFKATAAKIDPKRAPLEVQASLQEHPPAGAILPAVKSKLDGLKKFIVDKGIVTIPSPVMPIVQETPPFERAFILASMDTPGPYEKATQAYYNVTLPDPKWTTQQTESYLRGALSDNVIKMVSIHEAFPGHYVQFLWMPSMKSKSRKLYSCSSNAEGWAHYSEQMMLDEGYGDADPKLRLSQLQEALLRATRYVAGIRMHTRGMTLEQAIELFQKQGFQSAKVAEMEAKRGTQDPTYLYYTYGKLQILKLRDEYKQKLGSAYTLRKFHDAFLAQGAAPLPLVRKALLEQVGR
jgi:uncharacterized protein (DUF885 family)